MFVEHHVTAVCKAGLYHLRNISRIRRYISRHTAEILMLLLSPVWIFVTHYFQDGKGKGGAITNHEPSFVEIRNHVCSLKHFTNHVFNIHHRQKNILN